MNIKDALDKIILNMVDRNPNISISVDADLIDEFALDSIQLISIIIHIENEFHITFRDEMLTVEFLRYYKNILTAVLDMIKENKNG